MSDDVATPAQVLSTNIFDSAAEAIEAIGAADVLGLGDDMLGGMRGCP